MSGFYAGLSKESSFKAFLELCHLFNHGFDLYRFFKMIQLFGSHPPVGGIGKGELERFDVSWKHQKRPKLLFSINLSDF